MSAHEPDAHGSKRNRPAEPADLDIRPLPDKHTLVPLDRRFTAQEMQRIRMGLIPRQMEDKWFIYWCDGRLFRHRSWTGLCIYVVRFSCEQGACVMTEAKVNRDPAQYKATDDARDAALISYLIDVLLLRRPAAYPADASSGEQAALAQWSLIGRAMLGDQADEE